MRLPFSGPATRGVDHGPGRSHSLLALPCWGTLVNYSAHLTRTYYYYYYYSFHYCYYYYYYYYALVLLLQLLLPGGSSCPSSTPAPPASAAPSATTSATSDRTPGYCSLVSSPGVINQFFAISGCCIERVSRRGKHWRSKFCFGISKGIPCGTIRKPWRISADISRPKTS